MGWLTGYSYRMAAEVANPSALGDRLLNIPIPAWFLRAQGKVARADYYDVHVTKADGTTELPCTLNAAKNSIQVDYAAMPVGETTLYAYYGKADATAPTAASFSTASTEGPEGGTLIDNGAESGTNGAALGAAWTLSGAGGTATYSTAQKKVGSQSFAVTCTTGAYKTVNAAASAGMNATGAEMRGWVYGISHGANQSFYLSDYAGTLASSCFWVRGGDILGGGSASVGLDVYTMRAATGYTQNGYTTIGTFPTGWFEWRIVLDFTAKTYTFSTRTDVAGAWTQYKASGASTYNIPFTGSNTITQTAGFMFQTNGGTAFTEYLDDIRYSNTGVSSTTPGTSTVAQIIPFNGEQTAEDGMPTDYIWGADLDATYLDSGADTTYNGAATQHMVGIDAAGRKYHYLIKPGEWTLRKGTVSAAKLYLYAESAPAADVTIRAHRFKNYGEDSAVASTRHERWVRNGWSCQETGAPTWNTRFLHYQADNNGSAIAWQTAGGTHANEIETEYDSLTVAAAGFAAGYKAMTLTASRVNDWQGDFYSHGYLIKDSTDSAGASNRTLTLTSQTQTNTPVIEITYSALAADQLTARKLTTDTYSAATFPTLDRYAQIPSEDGFAVMLVCNAEMRADVFYVSATGRIRRIAKNQAPASGGGRFNQTTPTWGLYHDPDTHRFWIGAVTQANSYMVLGYSDPYVAESWAWAVSSTYASKSVIMPKNDVVYVVHFYYNTATGQGSRETARLRYLTYTRGTGTWSATTDLAYVRPQGTTRNVATSHDIGATDVMSGSGEIWLDGAVTSYPSFGGVWVGTEFFWYTGKDAVNNKLTGVTRGLFASTKAAHAATAPVVMDRWAPTYMSISYDGTAFHVTYCVNSAAANNYFSDGSGTGILDFSSTGMGYLTVVHLKYCFTHSRWEDAAGNALTLPLTQLTEPVISRSNAPAYTQGLACLSDGSVAVVYAENVNPTATGGAANNTGTRVAHFDGSWHDVDVPDIFEASIVDVSSGIATVTGIDATTSLKVQDVISADGAASFPETPNDLATHSFATTVTNWTPPNILWCSSNSEKANLSGKGLIYEQHFCYHGAVYLDAVGYTTVPLTAGAGGAGVASAVLTALVAALASSPASSLATATLGALVSLTAQAVGTAQVQAALGTLLAITASAEGVGAAAAALGELAPLEAAAQGQAGGEATLTAIAPILAEAAGVSTADVTMEQVVAFATLAAGGGGAQAALDVLGSLAASAAGASDATAQFVAVLAAIADARGASTVTASLDGMVTTQELEAVTAGTAEAAAVLDKLIALGTVVAAGYGSVSAAQAVVVPLATQSAGAAAVLALSARIARRIPTTLTVSRSRISVGTHRNRTITRVGE